MKFEDITSEALELMLKSTEHDFVERKSRNDHGGWLRTAVAFANSAPIGWPAVLFVGADDNGNPQVAASDQLEAIIKSVSATLDQAFPAIYRHVIPLHLTGGSCVAIVIPGSSERPHFAGQSYIRVGTETKLASDEQFQTPVAQRGSKARMIVEYKGKTILLETIRDYVNGFITSNKIPWVVADCNQFFVTLRALGEAPMTNSYPLEWIDLSFDNSQGTLLLIIEQYGR